jgi:hypothetical protein
LWLTRRSAFRRLIGALARPREERGFGFWWLVATIAIAGAVGLIVAALVTPVAGLLAVLAVGIWALISHLSGRRAEAKRQERRERGASGGAPGTAAPAADHGPPIATAPAAH